ncbi:hypothetical protein SDC9_91124 [bioreactor metagenome]|jgi:hypothetical protein|uniref:Uncharacterized protein n=1 Tax=bioreactor metagenome TaxID=1076179 RepID=A0A644ZUP3_9ZZZZ
MLCTLSEIAVAEKVEHILPPAVLEHLHIGVLRTQPFLMVVELVDYILSFTGLEKIDAGKGHLKQSPPLVVPSTQVLLFLFILGNGKEF